MSLVYLPHLLMVFFGAFLTIHFLMIIWPYDDEYFLIRLATVLMLSMSCGVFMAWKNQTGLPSKQVLLLYAVGMVLGCVYAQLILKNLHFEKEDLEP